MALTESQFIALEGNINEVWDAYFKMKKDYIPTFYNIIKKNTAQFTDYTVGAAGRMSAWTGSVSYDSINPGYTKQYKPDKYSTGIQIDRDMWEDKEYERIKTRVNSIAYGVFKTLQYHSADIFNEAFSTSIYTGPDSASLCSASHHNVAGDTAQTNTNTLDLDYDNLETALRAMEDFTDDRGDKMLINGDMVIASPYYRDTCKKLFGSDKEAFVADNNKNIYKDFEFMIHPLITGKKWFVVNRELMKNGSGLNWFMRRDPKILERDGDAAKGDFNTEKLSWKAVGRWEKGWTNWFWCYGNQYG
jgi:phage major head subunit gpT-like protein